jgi:hypothetical protein
VVLVGPAFAVSCVVSGRIVIVITFIIVLARVIVSRRGDASSVDRAYYAAVVMDRMAVTKLRRLKSCMIRINNTQRLGIKDRSSNYSKDKSGWV